MKFVKQHKFTVLIIIVFIVFVIGLFLLYNLFFSNGGKPSYGNRLDGIDSVNITDDTLNKLSSGVKKNNKVLDVSANISGRTLEIIITVEDKLSIADAKKIGESSLSTLSDKQVEYFSVQIFVKKNDSQQNNFPIIGYKQKNTKKIVWTKDRKVTSSNEK